MPIIDCRARPAPARPLAATSNAPNTNCKPPLSAANRDMIGDDEELTGRTTKRCPSSIQYCMLFGDVENANGEGVPEYCSRHSSMILITRIRRPQFVLHQYQAALPAPASPIYNRREKKAAFIIANNAPATYSHGLLSAAPGSARSQAPATSARFPQSSVVSCPHLRPIRGSRLRVLGCTPLRFQEQWASESTRTPLARRASVVPPVVLLFVQRGLGRRT
ncbi:hypothetical protein BJ912DRAFT_1067627 [Pholiota molesta]|nr:hypothetical protein BJ912DRAFT_1067627 [Pholiota molesta]